MQATATYATLPGETGLVSVMYVNNETGAVSDIEEISRVCQKYDILFHADCVQAAGYHSINTSQLHGLHFATISSHKIHGPKGVGALYVRDPSLLSPIIYGGGAQEFGLRGGTENVAGIVGFGKAAEIASAEMHHNSLHVSALKKLFLTQLAYSFDGLANGGIHINAQADQGSIVNLRIDGVSGEALMIMLNNKEIYISTGSACNSSSSEPSHVLKAFGLTDDEARQSIRVSFSKLNTHDQVIEAAQIMANCIMH